MRCLGRTQTFKRCKRDGKWPFCHSHQWQPWIAFFTVISVIATFGGLYQDIVRPFFLSNESVANDDEMIPQVALMLQNKTEHDIIVSARGDIVIWLPQGVDALRRIPGRYDLESNNGPMDSIITVPKGQNIEVIATIASEIQLDTLLKSGVGDLEFILDLNPGGTLFTGLIPFKRKNILTTRYQIDLSRPNSESKVISGKESRWEKTNLLLIQHRSV